MTYTLTRTNVRASPRSPPRGAKPSFHGPALSAPETQITRQRQNYHHRIEPWSGREGPCLSGQDRCSHTYTHTPRSESGNLFFLCSLPKALPRPMLCMIPTGLDWLCYGRAASRRNQGPGARGRVSTLSCTHTLPYPPPPPHPRPAAVQEGQSERRGMGDYCSEMAGRV